MAIKSFIVKVTTYNWPAQQNYLGNSLVRIQLGQIFYFAKCIWSKVVESWVYSSIEVNLLNSLFAKFHLPCQGGSQWKGINCKQSTRWQHLSRLKASVFFSLQNLFCCYETQQLILWTGTAIWWMTEPHKEPTNWLDGARPAKIWTPPTSFPRNSPVPLCGVPTSKNMFASTKN